MPGLDMLVRFGYCIICDNGPDKKNREWVSDIVKNKELDIPILGHCSTCKEKKTNKNLLILEVEVPGLGK